MTNKCHAGEGQHPEINRFPPEYIPMKIGAGMTRINI